MNRSPKAVLCAAALCMALGGAASHAASEVARVTVLAVTPDAKGVLTAARDVTIDVRLRGQLMGTFQSGADGTCGVPLYEGGVAHQVVLSKAGHQTVTLSVTYDAAGKFFTVGPAAGLGVVEKIGPGVYYTVALPPEAASKHVLKISVIDATRKDAAGRWLPVAGAAVTISQAGRSVASGTSAADGSYNSPPLAPGVYTVQAAMAGYKTFSLDVTMSDHNHGQVLPMTPEAAAQPAGKYRMILSVVQAGKKDAQGNAIPISGAAVVILEAGRIVASGTADAKGEYASPPLSPAKYTANISHAGFQTIVVEVEISSADVRRGVGLLPAAGPVGGQPMKLGIVDAVRRDAAGKPVPLAGAAIQISHAGQSVASGTSAADGSYQSPPLSPGDYVVGVSLAGYEALSVVIAMPAGGIGSELALKPQAAGPPAAQTDLGIHVVEESLAGQPEGKALAGAGVYVTQGGRIVANGATDATGKFSAMVPHGQCQLTVMKAGYQPGTRILQVGGRWGDVTVQLRKVGAAPPPPPPPPEFVTLTVVVRQAPTLNPVAGARVQFRQPPGEWGPATPTGADGTARLQVKPGTVYLRVKKDAFATADATVNVPAQDTSQLVILQPTAPK